LPLRIAFWLLRRGNEHQFVTMRNVPIGQRSYLPSPLTYSVVPISSNAQRTRYLAKGRFFGVAHLNAAAEQAAALGSRFGGALTDLAQPTLERSGVTGGLFSQQTSTTESESRS
jgi:hypothetical protein